MVIRTFISFVRYLLQLLIKITMLAPCRWNKLLGSYLVLLWFGQNAVKNVFYSKFKFKISFRFRSLLEWEWLIRWQQSVVSMVPWYRISRSYWVQNLQLSFCLYYRHLVVLALLVNFAFYQQYKYLHIIQWNIFCTFPEVAIVSCSRKYLFLKYDRKIRAKFLEMLEATIFFRGLPVLVASSLRQFCRHIQKLSLMKIIL